MTPLAANLAKKMTDPKTPESLRRKWRTLLYDTHFFNVTAILPLFVDLVERMDDNSWSSLAHKNFLPAPKTWIEVSANLLGTKKRWAFLFEETENTCLTYINDNGETNIFHRDDTPIVGNWFDSNNKWKVAAVFLLLINTPQVIGRRQHMPNRALEKRLIQNQKMIGNFPLHAWTELTLSIANAPKFDGENHEAHLTGERCLHFCRAHLRLWNGELIFIKAHWRGNPALGIKQTRYTVQP